MVVVLNQERLAEAVSGDGGVCSIRTGLTAQFMQSKNKNLSRALACVTPKLKALSVKVLK